MNKIIILDTETTGTSPIKPGSKWGEDYFKKTSDPHIWPKIVQISFIVYDVDKNKPLQIINNIIKLKDIQYPIPMESIQIHGITDEISKNNGIPIIQALKKFVDNYIDCDLVVGHNIQFDINVVCAELSLILSSNDLIDEIEKNKFKQVYDKLMNDYYSKFKYCTMRKSRLICNLPKYIYDSRGETLLDENGDKIKKLNNDGTISIKNPKLSEAYFHLFKEMPRGKLHDSLVDVAVCLRIFIKLYRDIDIFQGNLIENNLDIIKIVYPDNYKDSPKKTKTSITGRKRRSDKKF